MLDGSRATQASKWEERQRLIHNTIKLLNEDDGLELLKQTWPSLTLIQLQSDKRGISRRSRVVLRNSPGSFRVNWISMALSGKSADFSRVVSMIEEMASVLHDAIDRRC